MDKLLYLLPVLACPIGMGIMMWFMSRGNNTAAPNTAATQPDRNTQEEIAILRTEIATLRAGQQSQTGAARGGTG